MIKNSLFSQYPKIVIYQIDVTEIWLKLGS